MNLLMRALRFIALAIFHLTINVLVFLIRLLLPFLLAALRMLRALVSLSLTATINGPTQFADRLASEWTRNLLVLGVPGDHMEQIYGLCRFLAVSLIVMGWAVAALFTVAILRVVFGLFI